MSTANPFALAQTRSNNTALADDRLKALDTEANDLSHLLENA